MIGPRVRAAVVLLFVFAAGAVAGVFLDRHHLAPPAVPTDVSDKLAEHEAAMAELREALDLDDAQVEQIEAVFASHREIVRQMWDQLRPEVQEAMRQVHLEINEILRPEQRERFHAWLMSKREQAPHSFSIH